MGVPYADPTNTGEWAKDLLTELGDPLTASNVGYLEAWQTSESPSGYGYNPLGTEEKANKSTNANAAGVQAYTSWADGLAATLATLFNNSANDPLLARLKQGNATLPQLSQAQAAPGASWATGGESKIAALGTPTTFTYGGVQGEQKGAAGVATSSRGVLGDIGYTLTHPFQIGEQGGTDIANASGLSNSDLASALKNATYGPLVGWIAKGAADVTFVGFGLLLVVVGLAITFRSEGEEAAPAAAAAVA